MADTNELNKVVEAEQQQVSWSQFCSGLCEGIKKKSGKDWLKTTMRVVGLLACIYVFLFSLSLMTQAFKVMGGCSAGGMFDGITNPIAGLMIGVLSTALIQSSSSVTSIVVAMVGAGSMSVPTAIPIVMGSNIGTSITNTVVSMGQINDKDQFERAFAGATVHDMFNMLTVVVLLPIEVATGYLYHLTAALVPEEVGKGDKFEGPLKKIVSPLINRVLHLDKKLAGKIALGQTTCDEVYARVAKVEDVYGEACSGKATGIVNCACDKATKTLQYCPAFFKPNATFDDDMAAGAVTLVIAVVLLIGCLASLVKLLQYMLLGTSEEMLKKATNLNGYLAILLGAAITFVIQSSSIVTSVLTPLVGIGILPIEKMFPLTAGANLGTTGTAVMASMVSGKPSAIQAALCHFFFNLSGILIFYPIPFMRRLPINLALSLGAATRRYRAFPIIYCLIAFIITPAVLMGLASLFEKGSAYTVLGTILLVCIVFSVGYFIFWYKKRGGAEAIATMMADRQERADATKTLPAYKKSTQEEIDELKATMKEFKATIKELQGSADVKAADVKVHLEE